LTPHPHQPTAILSIPDKLLQTITSTSEKRKIYLKVNLRNDQIFPRIPKRMQDLDQNSDYKNLGRDANSDRKEMLAPGKDKDVSQTAIYSAKVITGKEICQISDSFQSDRFGEVTAHIYSFAQVGRHLQPS